MILHPQGYLFILYSSLIHMYRTLIIGRIHKQCIPLRWPVGSPPDFLQIIDVKKFLHYTKLRKVHKILPV